MCLCGSGGKGCSESLLDRPEDPAKRSGLADLKLFLLKQAGGVNFF